MPKIININTSNCRGVYHPGVTTYISLSLVLRVLHLDRVCELSDPNNWYQSKGKFITI